MSIANWSCPDCGRQLPFDLGVVGAIILCPKCGKEFKLSGTPEIFALKLVIALKKEWEREPSLIKCRKMADVAFACGIQKQTEFDYAVKFLADNHLIYAAKDQDGKMAAQPNEKGFAFLESRKPKPQSVLPAEQSVSALLDQKDANDHPRDEKLGNQIQQVHPGDGNNGKRSRWTKGFFDDVFKFLESIGFVSWMFHEWFPDTHKIWLLIAIIFALAGAFYILAHKILIQKAWMILTWVAYFCCIVFIAKNSAIPASNLKWQPSDPDLRVYLQIGDDTATEVLLTNAFVPLTSNMNINIGNLGSGLVVPIKSNQPNVSFEFEVRNHSIVSAEGVSLWVGISDDWEWTAQNG